MDLITNIEDWNVRKSIDEKIGEVIKGIYDCDHDSHSLKYYFTSSNLSFIIYQRNFNTHLKIDGLNICYFSYDTYSLCWCQKLSEDEKEQLYKILEQAYTKIKLETDIKLRKEQERKNKKEQTILSNIKTSLGRL